MWAELGIEPTTDQKAIRQAYVARLRAIRVDADPKAFIRLREAYEQALRESSELHEERDDHWESSCEDEDSDNDDQDRSLASQNVHTARQEPHSESGDDVAGQEDHSAHYDLDRIDLLPSAALNDFQHAFENATASHEALRALALFDSAMASGVVPLGRERSLIPLLVECALQDRTLLADTFKALLHRFGLDAAIQPSGSMADLAKRCRARVEANDWYAKLIVDADRWALGSAKQPAISARIVLRRIGRMWFHGVDENLLQRRLAEYRKHENWTSDRINPPWIATLERKLKGYTWRRRVRRQAFWVLFWLLWIVGILVGQILPALNRGPHS